MAIRLGRDHQYRQLDSLTSARIALVKSSPVITGMFPIGNDRVNQLRLEYAQRSVPLLASRYS